MKVPHWLLYLLIKLWGKNKKWLPRVRCYAFDHSGMVWVALDNSTDDCWVEEFSMQHVAVGWLKGEFEVSDLYDQEGMP